MASAFVPSISVLNDRTFSHQQGGAIAANKLPSPVLPMNPAISPLFYTCSSRRSSTRRYINAIDALGTQDLVDGSILAFALAFLFSFLQERRREKPQSLSDSLENTMLNNTTAAKETKQDNVFDSWKEMSRPESYVYYNNKVKRSNKQTQQQSSTTRQEKKWVLVALLVLFVPIFSAEFFLALSRQVLCGGDPLTQSAFAAELCSPAHT